MNPKATFQSVSVEPISWQPQESVFITMCVREKHWRRFGVDTREDRGKWIKNGACSPARPQKREGMIQSPRSPFLKSLGVTWGPSRDASGLVDRFQYSSAVRCPVSTSAEQPAFKVTGGVQKLFSVPMALGLWQPWEAACSCMNGRGTLHREERERPTLNGVCCFTVMGIGAVNRNLGIIVDNLTSFIPIGQLGLETSRYVLIWYQRGLCGLFF